ERIWALSEARKRSVGLDFVIVDYDQLVIEAGIDDQDEKSFFAHQGRFVNQAQKFAKRLDICMIIVAQMRKMPAGAIKGGSFRMQLDDIYGHSAIRNAPDVIIAVFRDFFLKDRDPKFERDAQAHVVKARNGQTGKVKMDFDPRRLRFSDKVGPVDVFEESENQLENGDVQQNLLDSEIS
ncbi:MAG TPA: DnaB-like helicase C-terminal domain-containing protein, partial [Candidatus Baltobacteraceae bacterium]|nr:DnaB-like helicase C-terminal domain-containing protein [Candidatus Baltobacteraceae bacterium]